MSTPATSAPRPVSNRGKWLLAALCLASLAVLALLIPSIRSALGDEEQQGPLSAVALTIEPLSKTEKKACPKEIREVDLQRATTAVTGVATTSKAGEATFVADHWFKGGPADRVVLTSSDETKLQSALSQAGLTSGRVLIASRSGEVLMCGESGTYSTDLAALYVSAFEQ
mgnify:CR=1 FL=1